MKICALVCFFLVSCSSTYVVNSLRVPENYKSIDYIEVSGEYYPLGLISYGTWEIETIDTPITSRTYSIFKVSLDSLCYYDSVITDFQSEYEFKVDDTVACFDNFYYKGLYFMSEFKCTAEKELIPLSNWFNSLYEKGKIEKINCP